MPFPSTLRIPAVTAASLHVDASLTARDLARMVSVAWYAGKHGVTPDGTVDVPDDDMRTAMGGIKRQDIDREVSMFARLERLDGTDAAAMTSDTLPDLIDGVAAPVVSPAVRRMYIAGARRWTVADEIVEAFTPDDGERTVELPTSILAGARSRYTLPLMLRLLAWQSGEIDRKWLLRRDERHLHVRVPIADMISEIGAGTLAGPVDVYRYALSPAAQDIAAATGAVVDIVLIRAPSTRGPDRGRVLSVEITMMMPDRQKPRTRERGPVNKWGGPVAQPGVVVPMTVPLAAARRPTRVVVEHDDYDVPF